MTRRRHWFSGRSALALQLAHKQEVWDRSVSQAQEAARRMSPVVYRRKSSAVSRGERVWRVEDDALVTRGASGRERRYRWADIASVRLYAEPARFRPWRYVFELRPKQARRILLDNCHCLGLRAYEDRSASYTPFVRAALARLALANPKLRALLGETQKRYFFLVLAVLLGMGAAAFALIALRTPLDSLPYASAIKLAVVLLMLPAFWIWVIRAMPRGAALDAIPDRAFPPG